MVLSYGPGTSKVSSNAPRARSVNANFSRTRTNHTVEMGSSPKAVVSRRSRSSSYRAEANGHPKELTEEETKALLLSGWVVADSQEVIQETSPRAAGCTITTPTLEPPQYLEHLAARKTRLEEADMKCSEDMELLKARLEQLDTQRAVMQTMISETSMLMARIESEWPCGPELILAPDAKLEVTRAVGLPNRSADCFWASTLVCLRNVKPFLEALTPSLTSPTSDLAGAVARLFYAMQVAGETRSSVWPRELAKFRNTSMEALSRHGQERLIQASAFAQRQQDAHEFLNLFLDVIGSTALPDEGATSPRSEGPMDSDSQRRLAELENELTRLFRQSDVCPDSSTTEQARVNNPWAQQIGNLLYEYSMIQWAMSATRMHSRSLSSVFEGQRLAHMKCSKCSRVGISGAEPFVVEEIQLSACVGSDAAGFLNKLNEFTKRLTSPRPGTPESLKDLLRPTELEGYKCPKCFQIGCTTYSTRYFRLPAILIFHINRAHAEDQRCETPVAFESSIDVVKLGIARHFGQTLCRNLSPCSSRYRLIGVVFHRGPNAKSGHYFAYVLQGGRWLRVDDEKVHRPEERYATPMALESANLDNGPKAVLLFYERC